MTAERGDRPAAKLYEIRVRGHLGPTMRSAFGDLKAETSGTDTRLTGPLQDQSALHGMIAQIESLGLELLEVRRLPDRGTSSDPIDGR
jgi:hypothetical protein